MPLQLCYMLITHKKYTCLWDREIGAIFIPLSAKHSNVCFMYFRKRFKLLLVGNDGNRFGKIFIERTLSEGLLRTWGEFFSNF